MVAFTVLLDRTLVTEISRLDAFIIEINDAKAMMSLSF